jgi:formamidopyrimidine-DNA glycosylase
VPELPDIEVYREALEARVLGERLEGIRLSGISWLRSVEPRVEDLSGRRVEGVRRLGKRLVFALTDQHFAVLHLMIAGRLLWKKPGAKPPGRRGLGAIDFSSGTLVATEASTKKRATLHLVRGEASLAEHDPGGVEPLECGLEAFSQTIQRENHTLKRCLTDPHLFSGIGNAYSDEILHRAQLSPFKQSGRMKPEELERLHRAVQATLLEWVERLRGECGEGFPEKVTAFRPEMAVHGRYREPCPRCGDPVQRIAYAENEANYCATCQTGGKLLADRALSRLLRGDWPKTVEELERRRGPRAAREK